MAAVLEYLQGRGQVFTVIPHPRAPISADRAHPARIPKELLVKTVVVMAELAPVVLVVPAAREIDPELVSAAVGTRVRVATESELERQFPDYEVGALPPLSLLLLAPMFVDPAVLERRDIVFAAGRTDVSIRMSTRDLFGNDPVVIAPLTAESRVVATT